MKIGDILVCKPGMRVAADGTIKYGETHLDEALITGESVPSKKSIGDYIVAGAINVDGYIEYQVDKSGPNSTISEIVRLVFEATNSKAPIAKLADIISGYFVPSILLISVITFIGYLILGYELNNAIISFVTVLVVACPCALGLATPLAVVISEGVCAKKGILVKNSETLENSHKIDTIIFDKTGTLTYGDLRVSSLYNSSKYNDKKLLEIVASLESNSTHPISNAFKEYDKSNIKVENYKEMSGMGIFGIINKKEFYVGNNKILKELSIENKYQTEEDNLSTEGNSVIYIVENKKIIGIIGVKDIVRDNVRDIIKKLSKMNKRIIMLSGDNENTANYVAKSLGIKEVIANVFPKEKEQVLSKIMNDNHIVMMIGDGINDAPALARANIGVSINSGTDIAGNSSDVILMNDDLSKIVDLIDISKKTVRKIKQNLFRAFFYNICMISIAIGLLKPIGISLSPMFASMAMVLSSLTVVFNSLSLRERKK